MLKLNARKSVLTNAITLLTTISFLVCSPGAGAGPSVYGLGGGNKGVSAPPVDVLPKIRNVVQGVAGLERPTSNQLVVRQNQPKAILDWNSFDIGEKAWTHFDQKGNTDWVALNRIFTSNPSLIFGKLTADGKVYLINQNGTLFGPNSKVNVHSLVGSSLRISEEDFLGNRLRFAGDETAGKIENQGELRAKSGGGIFLIGPEVENKGVIIAPSGQIALAAGSDVEIAYSESRLYPYLFINAGAGSAENAASGSMSTEGGLAGMYGRVVNQEGIITSVSAISNNGRIELRASEKVKTGAASRTSTPISDDPESVHKSFKAGGGQIDIGGLDRNDGNRLVETAAETIEHHGAIAAPAGSVALRADQRVYVGNGSKIDVSGEWVERPGESNQVQAQLNSIELKNDFGQKGGILQGQPVAVNPQTGSAIGDLSGSLNFEFKTAKEFATKGGSVSLSAPSGEVVIREGSEIDFSGGGRIFAGGTAVTTTLVSGNRIYDLSTAPQWLQYEAIFDRQEFTNKRFNISKEYTGLFTGGGASLKNVLAGYREGDDAGSLLLSARGIVLDGRLSGAAYPGVFQTGAIEEELMVGNYAVQVTRGTRAPRGGRLVIGGGSASTIPGSGANLIVDEVILASQTASLPETFSPDQRFVEVVVKDGAAEMRPLLIEGAAPFASEFTEVRYWSESQQRFVSRSQWEAAQSLDQPDVFRIDNFPLFRTRLSAGRINAAGLSDVTVTANTKVTIDRDARVRLSWGGNRIDDQGEFIPGAPLKYLDEFPATFSVSARAIEHAGDVSLAGGQISMVLFDTITSPNLPNTSPETKIDTALLKNRIFLADGSLLSAAGERIFNNLAGDAEPLKLGPTAGGSIRLADTTTSEANADIAVRKGATLDVSGGYEIDPAGTLKGGAAGSLDIRAGTIALEGRLKGHSLTGQSGGEVRIQSDLLQVRKAGQAPALPEEFSLNSDLPAEFGQGFVFEENRLDAAGFAKISLISGSSLEIGEGVSLRPSPFKLSPPSPADNPLVSPSIKNNLAFESGAVTAQESGADTIAVPLELIGASGFVLQSGLSKTGFSSPLESNDTVSLGSGALVETAPRGTIELSGRLVDVAGTLQAPAGKISLSATGLNSDLIEFHTLNIRNGSRISAAGQIIPQKKPAAEGLTPGFDVLDGGQVILKAANRLLLEDGAVVDVSGTQAVPVFVSDDRGQVVKTMAAGAAGKISIEFVRQASLDGQLIGRTFLPSVRGGSLSLRSRASEENSRLVLSEDQLRKWGEFEYLSFQALRKIEFVESPQDPDGFFHIAKAGKLEFDTPLLALGGLPEAEAAEIRLSAPWIALSNTSIKYSGTGLNSYETTVGSQAGLQSGKAEFSISGEWIDLGGSIAFSGFKQIAVGSKADLRLSDEIYTDNRGQSLYRGELRSPSDVTLEAGRIYPATLAEFAFKSEAEGGRISIRLPSDDRLTRPGPIVSAGGKLVFTAAEIEHSGYVAAPMGEVRFEGRGAGSIVLLGDGSVTTTKAESLVPFGTLANVTWTAQPKPSEKVVLSFMADEPVEEAPKKSIQIQAETIVAAKDAIVDASGGGGVFGFEFIPGVEGLVNPLLKAGRSVVVPGISLPGPEVRLTAGGKGLAAGTYSLLPQEYAFLPGALVLEDLGTTLNPSALQISTEGFPVVAGYATELGTGLSSNLARRYSVRTASDALSEGKFNYRSIAAGAGGDIGFQGSTTIMDGTIRGDTLDGFDGGVFAVSGTKSAVVRATQSIPAGVSTLDDIMLFLASEDALATVVNRANVRAAGISNQGLEEIRIGQITGPNVTESVTIEKQVTLETPVITLSASNLITLERGSRLLALGEGGEANLLSPAIVVEKEALVRATESVHLRTDVNPAVVPRLVVDGSIEAENSFLSLTANRIVVFDDNPGSGFPSIVDDPEVLFIPDSLTGFSGFDHVELNAGSNLAFAGAVEFAVASRLDLNTPGINANPPSGNTVTVRSRLITFTSPDAAAKSPAELDRLVSELAVGSGPSGPAIDFLAENISVGPGNFKLEGFGRVGLHADGDLTLVGRGTLATGGELQMAAARVATAPFVSQAEGGSALYETAHFSLNAGRLNIEPGTGSSNGAVPAPGGRLELAADFIRHAGFIDAFAGRVSLRAAERVNWVSQKGIILADGAVITARGGILEYELPGGKVLEAYRAGLIDLKADAGGVEVKPSATLDVSNLPSGDLVAHLSSQETERSKIAGLFDAGAVSLSAPAGETFLDGTLLGGSHHGHGGSFTVDSGSIGDFAGLNLRLASGGFTGKIDVRARSGSILVPEGLTVKAREIRLAADLGAIDIRGTLDASQPLSGGRIELWAKGALEDTHPSAVSLGPSARILADGTGAAAVGGEVLIGVDDAFGASIDFGSGALISTKGSSRGGQVIFRAPRLDGNGDGLDDSVPLALSGTIEGSREVRIEAFKVYERARVAEADIGLMKADIESFFQANNVSQLAAGLKLPAGSTLLLIPGIEIRSQENLDFDTRLDFSPWIAVSVPVLQGGQQTISVPDFQNWWRFGEQPVQKVTVPGIKNLDIVFPEDWAYPKEPEWSYSGVGGTITLRAKNNLSFSGDIVDHPTDITELSADAGHGSDGWSVNLVAGADLNSANLTTTLPGAGDLIIGDRLIYSERGAIRFASGRDVIIGATPPAKLDGASNRFMLHDGIGYNLASFSGEIRGEVLGNLSIDGGAIHSAVSPIFLSIGKNLYLNLSSGSAIRTTGIGAAGATYAEFGGGGSIRLEVGESLSGGGDPPFWFDNNSSQFTNHLDHWDNVYDAPDASFFWSADYGQPFNTRSTPTAGVATMAGGDLTVIAGGNLAGQFGTFKTGALTVLAGQDVNGLFQVAGGSGTIQALGNFTSGSNAFDSSLSLLAGQATVSTQGSIDFGTAFNPTFPPAVAEYSTLGIRPQGNLTYSDGGVFPMTRLRLFSAQDGVTISGEFKHGVGGSPAEYRVLPPRLDVEAAGDIRIRNLFDFALAPAPSGNLRLVSGGNISGLSLTEPNFLRPLLNLTDLQPDKVYFPLNPMLAVRSLPSVGVAVEDLFLGPNFPAAHAPKPVHLADPEPVELLARGRIEELIIFSSKPTRIEAGGDIVGLHFFGQNLKDSDLTAIRTAGSIRMNSNSEPVFSASDARIFSTGYIFTGPGDFLVQAGQSIDLGITQGIQTSGNSYNEALPLSDAGQEKSALFLVAGVFKELDGKTIKAFFSELQENGKLFSELKESGDQQGALDVVRLTDQEVIEPFFQGGILGQGDIFMTSSQISSGGKSSSAMRPFDEQAPERLSPYAESSDIYLVATGSANIGLTAIPDPSQNAQHSDSGIFSSEGGRISIFTVGDLNVNESRIMTFRSGDILAYNQKGNINAGRGAKTAINAGSPTIVSIRDEEGNITGRTLEFEPPALGSGIRTLTYDPDGFLGPQRAPLAGDASLFAPQGIIDAGEAGISARNLILGATQVLNTQNISITGTSVGVPQASAGPSIAALAGAGTVSEAAKMASESTTVKGAEERLAKFAEEMNKNLVPKMILVEVLGFEEEKKE